jgi:hypothetical protein
MTEVAEAVEKKTKQYALDLEKQLKELTGDLSRRYWKMAELISNVHTKNTWSILGHESVNAYREAVFLVSKGTWYERRRLWDEFAIFCLEKDLLTRARLDRLTSQNAKQLLRLPEKKRFTQKWIELALSCTESELEAKVDHVLENDTEPEDAPTADPFALLKIRCVASQKQFILEGMEEFGKQQEPPLNATDDAGRIIELMMADWLAGKQGRAWIMEVPCQKCAAKQ